MAAFLVACALAAAAAAPPPSPCDGEVLPNGICLPREWPPIEPHTHRFPDPPYLTAPPDTIALRGRQLFVDGFLVDAAASSGVETTFHNATYRDDINPVVRPDKPWEGSDDVTTAFASPFSGGVWWDPWASEFKMWYRCGPSGKVQQCLATSPDGIRFDKPELDVVPGTNVVQTDGIDGSTVWLDADPDTPPAERFKMAAVFDKEHFRAFSILSSPDGVHWTTTLNTTGPIQDRSSVFLNPHRSPRQWVYSIKSGPVGFGRSRSYWESEQLGVNANWSSACSEVVCNASDSAKAWTNADAFDPPWGCGSEGYTQLYNLDGVAYESVVVGLFSIFTGKYCKSGAGFNRTGEWDSVFLGFSRDGFHWTRPVIDGQHRVFLPMDATVVKDGNWRWNKANVQSVGGGFTVQQNGPMRFYVGARTGTDQIIGNATAGVAELRRDGFASVSAPSGTGTLVTKPVRFDGGHFFVNAERADLIKVAVLDAATMSEFPGLGDAHWAGPSGGSSSGDIVEVGWKGGAAALGKAAGQRVRLRFRFSGADAQLFSFWFSETPCGASGGFVAAGGPGYNSSRDTVGRC